MPFLDNKRVLRGSYDSINMVCDKGWQSYPFVPSHFGPSGAFRVLTQVVGIIYGR